MLDKIAKLKVVWNEEQVKTITNITYHDVPLPWQTSIWQQLHDRFQKNKLAHALLLTGAEGFGQGLFAKAFARSLLTQGNADKVHLFDRGNHPDFFYIRPEADSNIIKIEQIRELQAKLAQSRHSSLARIVLFESAHALNIAASNALLKSIEEPSEASFFLLVTSHPQKLKATLRSRCQQIKFGEKNQFVSMQWLQKNLIADGTAASTADYFLKLAEGAPLHALLLSKKSAQQLRKDFFIDVNALMTTQISPSALAEKWAKQNVDELVCLLLIWLLDLVRLHHQALVIHALPKHYCETLYQWREKLDLYKIYVIFQELYKIRASLSRVSSMNVRSMLESIFIALL